MKNKSSSNEELSSSTTASNSEMVSKNRQDTMNLAGIANSAAGVFLAQGIQKAFTPKDKRSVTVGDLKKLENIKLEKVYPIKNMPPNQFGQKPYFDIGSGNVIYLGQKDISSLIQMG